jgi:hypothetical protein
VFGNTEACLCQRNESTVTWKSGTDPLPHYTSGSIILYHWLPWKQIVDGVYYADTLKTQFRNTGKRFWEFLTK